MDKEIMEALQAAVDEEKTDREKYLSWANNPILMKYCGIFRDIAHDEHTHKKMIERIITEVELDE